MIKIIIFAKKKYENTAFFDYLDYRWNSMDSENSYFHFKKWHYWIRFTAKYQFLAYKGIRIFFQDYYTNIQPIFDRYGGNPDAGKKSFPKQSLVFSHCCREFFNVKAPRVSYTQNSDTLEMPGSFWILRKPSMCQRACDKTCNKPVRSEKESDKPV